MIPKTPAFTTSEYRMRQNRARELMASHGLDLLVAFSAASVNYLCGMDSENWFDFQAVVLPLDEEPTLFILDFELARAENSADAVSVRTYSTDDDPIIGLLSVLQATKRRTQHVGLEQGAGLTARQYRRLAEGRHDFTFEDSFGVLESLRLVKSEAEIAYMRAAAALTDRGIDAGMQTISVGATDRDVAAEIVHTMYSSGSDSLCWGPVVAAGYRSGSAHSTFCGQRIGHGDTVFLELTGEVKRYTAPLMRTAFLGSPPEELLQIEQCVREALTVVCGTARAGVPASVVARAALNSLRPAIDRAMVFHYNFGYPVGLGFPPSWIEQLGFFLCLDNDEPLKSGMTFHLPFSLRRYGEFACNLSHTILVGSERSEPLTNSSARLVVLE